MQGAVLKQTSTKLKKKESDDEIAITGYSEARGSLKKEGQCCFWMIKRNMSLIHKQFPHVCGLTDSSIG